MTDSQKTLAQHLADLLINARAKENGSSFTIVTDIDHRADYDVTSVEEFERHDDECPKADI